MSQEYDCSECGLCCTQYGAELYFYEEDLARWRQAEETKILRHLRVLNGIHNGWQNEDGTDLAQCPFLTTEMGFRCAVYETRPLVCRHFANGGSACRSLRQKHGLSVYPEN